MPPAVATGGSGGSFPCTAPTVQLLVLSKKRSPLTRLDVWPWGIGYAAALNFFALAEEDAVLPSVALGFVIVTHVFAFLFQAWSIRWRHLVRTTAVTRLEDADCVLVLPVEHSGAAEIVDLVRVPDASDEALPSTGSGPGIAGTLRAAHHLEGKSNAELATLWLRRARVQFTFQNMVFHLTVDSNGVRAFAPLDALDSAPLSVYQQWRGWSSKQAAAAAEKYGPNVIRMPLPTFGALMAEHVVAPFFVFQVACVALWMLDEYWYYSLFTLFMLVSMEAVLVQQRIKQHQSLRGMRPPPGKILLYRDGKWAPFSTEDCVPGDIVSLVRFKEPGTAAQPATPGAPTNEPVAADALILRGSVVVNEAMLTGESTPLMKDAISAAGDGGEALEESEHAGARTPGAGDGRSPVLNAFLSEGSRSHARHVVYGGTTLLQTSPHSETEDTGAGAAAAAIPAPYDGGATAVLLRTGVATSQGDLMRAIVHSTRKVTSGNREAFIFICGLLVFAVSASAYVLHHGLQDPKASRYKLALHCIMVITSVVPPELPIELALAVNNAIAALSKRGIFCTEPFRITYGGKVDVAAFDKTGTLTTDEFTVQGIGLPAGATEAATAMPIGGGMLLVGAAGVPDATLQVLAGCQSVMAIETLVPPPPSPPRRPFGPPPPPPPPAVPTFKVELIGDPLERAALKALKWTVGFDGVARPESMGHAPLAGAKELPRLPCIRSVKRWPFSAAVKRMSCAVVVMPDASLAPAAALAAGQLCIVTKGAPEVIAPLLAEVPRGYLAAYQSLAVKGFRVLALAHRVVAGRGMVMPGNSGGVAGAVTAVKAWTRTVAEAPGTMAFAGFLVLASPLKTDSKRVVTELRGSGHRVMMITGDAALTAVAVAVQTGIISKPPAAGAAAPASASGSTAVPSAWILDVAPGAATATNGAKGGAPALEWQVLPLEAVSGSAAARKDEEDEGDSAAAGGSGSAASPLAEDTIIKRQPYTAADLRGDATTGPLARGGALCVTGAAMHALMRAEEQNAAVLRVLCERAVVFSRVSPDQKEFVIVTLNTPTKGPGGAEVPGLTTLMCGDGTNDVGALKQASVGVSIISNAELEKRYDLSRLQHHRKRQELLAGGAALPPQPPADAPFAAKLAYAQRLQEQRALLARTEDEVDEEDTELLALLKQGGASTTLNAPAEDDALAGLLKKATSGLEAQAAAAAERAAAANPGAAAAPNGLLAKLKEMEAESATAGSSGPVMVALGDASIASPFTSKLPSPGAVLDILRQGRTALVVVQQMYRILAVNSLVSSVTLSALYLHGVRSGDTQATVAGIMISAMFLSVSWAGPLKKLSHERPRTTVFNAPLLLSVFGQAAIHLATLLTVVWACSPYMDKNIPSPFTIDEQAPAAVTVSGGVPGAEGGEGLVAGIASAGVDALKSALLARSSSAEADDWVESSGLAAILGSPAASGEPEAPRFKPNVLNTAVFLISLTQQTVTFLVNYTGKPFMQPLRRSSFIVKGSAVIFAFALFMCLGWGGSLQEQLELVDLPSDWGRGPVQAPEGSTDAPASAFHVSVRLTTAAMILLDVSLCWSLEQWLRGHYGIGTRPREWL